MKNKRPCIHGDLCRAIYKLTGRIYSRRCPYGCEFYEPVKKGGMKLEMKLKKAGEQE